MANNFDLFFQRVLADEGTAYEDVPGDSGGPTKCGITLADVARWNNVKCPKRGAKGWDDLVRKVHEINPGTARDIYKRFYWDSVRADELPSGLDYALVDYAVNSGVGRAVPALGALLGIKGAKVTDEMIAAARVYGSLPDLIGHLQDDRKAFLIRISEPDSLTYRHNTKFRRGWLDRESRVRGLALKLAANETPQKPVTTLPKAVEPSPAAVSPPTLPRMAKESKTVRLQAGALLMGIAAKVQTVAVTIGAGVTWLVSQLPDITADAYGQVSAVKDFAALVGARESIEAVAVTLGIVFVVWAAVRHLRDRKALKELKGE